MSQRMEFDKEKRQAIDCNRQEVIQQQQQLASQTEQQLKKQLCEIQSHLTVKTIEKKYIY